MDGACRPTHCPDGHSPRSDTPSHIFLYRHPGSLRHAPNRGTDHAAAVTVPLRLDCGLITSLEFLGCRSDPPDMGPHFSVADYRQWPGLFPGMASAVLERDGSRLPPRLA